MPYDARFASNRKRRCMNAHRVRWIALAASLLASAAQAAVDVHLSVAIHIDGGPGAKNVPPDKRYEIDATLSDTWMSVRDGIQTSFFDFDRRRRTDIDEATHTRVDRSLFDVPGFRVMEFANRQNLAKMMSAAKITQNQFDLIETEHIFSIQDKPANPLHAATNGDDTEFMDGTKTLARESMKATPVQPAQARMFAQLIRYTWGGHPQILAALAQSNGIPATLKLRMLDVGGTTTVTLDVTSVQASVMAPIDIAALPLQPVLSTQTPINQILARGAAFTDADIATARQRVRSLIDADFKDNRPFDAYLGIIEWMLTTGEPPPAMDAAQIATVNADPSVMALRAALAPHSKAVMQQAMDQLEALRPHTQAQGYMLELFVANDRASMGDRKAALVGLVDLLQAHPFVAGAYKDLGDNLLVSFDAPNAWRCWDIGRHIAHSFANFLAVDQFESSLVTQHPEYF
jgi:hypothetical protein